MVNKQWRAGKHFRCKKLRSIRPVHIHTHTHTIRCMEKGNNRLIDLLNEGCFAVCYKYIYEAQGNSKCNVVIQRWHGMEERGLRQKKEQGKINWVGNVLS